LPSNVEHHLLRIGQEAITNAVKHSQAKSIKVTLDYTGPDLILSVKDDGGGFSPEAVKQITQSGHFGLHGIRARANQIEAQLDISSQIEKAQPSP
jgi:signal transduction histidine kinase